MKITDAGLTHLNFPFTNTVAFARRLANPDGFSRLAAFDSTSNKPLKLKRLTVLHGRSHRAKATVLMRVSLEIPGNLVGTMQFEWGQNKCGDAENAESRRDWFMDAITKRRAFNNLFHSAFLCGLCAFAFNPQFLNCIVPFGCAPVLNYG